MTSDANPAPILTPLLAAAWCDAARIAPHSRDRHVECDAAGRGNDCYQIRVGGLTAEAIADATAILDAYASGGAARSGGARDAKSVILRTLRLLSHEVVYEDSGPVLAVNVLLVSDQWNELLEVRRIEERVIAGARAPHNAPQAAAFGETAGRKGRTPALRRRGSRTAGHVPTWCFLLATLVAAAAALALVGTFWDAPPDGGSGGHAASAGQEPHHFNDPSPPPTPPTPPTPPPHYYGDEHRHHGDEHRRPAQHDQGGPPPPTPPSSSFGRAA